MATKNTAKNVKNTAANIDKLTEKKVVDVSKVEKVKEGFVKLMPVAAVKAERSTPKKGDDVAVGCDAFGCDIGRGTNLANAVCYYFMKVQGHFKNRQIENKMREILERKQVRPQSPHSHHLATLGYAERDEDEKVWRLTTAAMKLAEYAEANDMCDASDLLAAEVKRFKKSKK